MRTFALFTLMILSLSISAQELHTPAEMMKIMEDSKLSYSLMTLTEKKSCPDRSDNVLNHNYYRVMEDSVMVTRSFSLKPDAEPWYEKAEAHFAAKAFDSARFCYEKVLEVDPAFTKAMTYVAQMYGILGNLDQSAEWYRRAIQANYIDYLAHWMIADIYTMQDRIPEAVDEITIASVLNRNNPRLRKKQFEIYEKAKLSGEDWCFNPQMELSWDEDKITIGFDEAWIGYALPKAVWAFEPGYRKSMGEGDSEFSMLEERECLYNLLIAMDNAKIKTKNYPDLAMLKKTVDAGFFSEYILYEILLPQYPMTANQLPEEVILGIKDYVIRLRQKK